MKRKSISQKTRFEVFKRDSFTCQYCGKKAPDVLLQVDHIKPVAKGGKNDIVNLITSCFDCNSGKSDRELSDGSVLEKQRKQVEMLEERRQQLEMLMQWHTELHEQSDYEVEKFTEYYNKVTGASIELTSVGIKNAKARIKKYGFQKVLEAIDIVANKYASLTNDDKLKKLGGILTYMTASDEQKQAMYIRGICRNRFSYCNLPVASELIKTALVHYEYDYLVDIAKSAKHWSHWRNWMEDLIDNTKFQDDSEPF